MESVALTNILVFTIIGCIVWGLIWVMSAVLIWIGHFSVLSWWAAIPIGVGFVYGLFVSVRNDYVL